MTNVKHKTNQKKRIKRDALLSSAYELFTQKGFAETTISDITNRAGVAKGTFYLYFEDKYDIRNILIRLKAAELMQRSYTSMLHEQNEKNAACTPEDAILFFTKYILKELTEDQVLLRFIHKNLDWVLLKDNIPNMDSPDPNSGGKIPDFLHDLFERSPVKYKDPAIMLYMVVGFVGSVCQAPILDNAPLPIEEMTPYILEATRGIIRSQEIREQQLTE